MTDIDDRARSLEADEAGEGIPDVLLGDDQLTEDASFSHLWSPIAVSCALSTVVAFTDAAALGGLAILLGSGLGTQSEGSFLGIGFLTTIPAVVLLTLATFALNVVNTHVRERTTSHWDAERRRDLVQAFQRADYPTQAAYSGAGLSTAAEQITKASTAIGAIVGLINSAVRTVIYVGIAVVISWQISLIVVVAGSLLTIGLRQLSKRTRLMHRRMAKLSIEIGEEIGEMATSARELHTLNRWDETAGALSREIGHLRHLRYRSAFLAGLVGPIYWMGTLLVGVAVVLGADKSSTSTAGIAASGLLLIRSLTAAQGAQTMFQIYNDSKPYVDRVRSVVATLRRSERRGLKEPVGEAIALKVSGADLTYGNDVVVEHLDLELDGPGGIALVGPSGSGKSTTMLALSGLVPPVEGSIAFNDVPLDLMDSAELSSLIGYLPQDPKLVRASLRSNLVRPDVDATDEDLWDAITAVGLDQTVAGFEGHLDAPMGRTAEGFSGGELQRLGLARLLVNQPGVWLVDEPTSALDRENSERVLSLLASAMEEHLVVIVTHRPDLLHHCRRVVFMEQGRIVDDGSLEDLVSRQPFIAAMIAGDAST